MAPELPGGEVGRRLSGKPWFGDSCMRHAVLVLLSCSAVVTRVHAGGINPNGTYPSFQMGVTGIHVTIERGLVVTVESTEPGSPAADKFTKGDVILSAGGRRVKGPDPRVPLGEAVGAAEAGDGRLVFRVNRGGREQDVTITIPVMGAYAGTWPLNCRKSQRIIRQTAEFVCKAQQPDGAYKLGKRPDRDSLTACMTGLFLLSTGDDRYLPNVRRQAHGLAAAAEKRPTGSTWHLGVQGILLGEYYLRTGDRAVLAGLRSLCRQAAKTQCAGAWGHGSSVNPGYVQSGLMNSAGVPVLTALALARECGITDSEAAFKRALLFFYRMAGHGCVCYGDHRAELFPNTNGRNGMLACALSLLDSRGYQMAARHLALIFADSYYAHEFGHTGGGFNVMWRGLGTVHVPKDRQSHYRRQMDKLAWYYDLCRLRGGGFSMLPSPPSTTRYCGAMWGTGAIGLAYTAPLKTLRITGAPPTKFSVKVKAPPLPWGRPADLAFLRTDYCEGFGSEQTPPDEIHARLRGRGTVPVEFCAKMMRHYSPMVRTWAARKLADKPDDAAVKEIVEALRHPDPRVRRAACDAISGYDNWGRPTAPGRQRGRITTSVVSAKCVPQIVKILKNPNAAWWEIDGALWALGRAEPADIRKNLPIIRKYVNHEEWYLREAAFWSIVGLRKTITGAEFQTLADIYAAERHVFARSSYDAGIRFLLQGEKVKLDAGSEARVVRTLGRTTHSAPIAAGYGTAGRHEAAHRTMMVLKHFDPKVYEWIVGDFVTYLSNWTPNYQHSAWLITGSQWQQGLIAVADRLGAKAGPLVVSLKECLDERIDKRSRDKAHVRCREMLQKGIREYEAKYALGGNAKLKLAAAKQAEQRGNLGSAYALYRGLMRMPRAGDFAVEAKRAVERLAKQAEQKLAAAEQAMKDKKFPEAIEALTDVTKQFAGSPFARRAGERLAKAEARLWEPKKSKTVAAPGNELEARRKSRAWLSIAESCAKAGRKETAVRYLNKVIDNFPNTTWAEEARKRLGRME